MGRAGRAGAAAAAAAAAERVHRLPEARRRRLERAASWRRVLLPASRTGFSPPLPQGGRLRAGSAGAAGPPAAAAGRARADSSRGRRPPRAAARAPAALAPTGRCGLWGDFWGEALPSSFTSLKAPRMTFAAGPRGLIGGEPAGAGGAGIEARRERGGQGARRRRRTYNGLRAAAAPAPAPLLVSFERRVPQVLVTRMSPPRGNLGPPRVQRRLFLDEGLAPLGPRRRRRVVLVALARRELGAARLGRGGRGSFALLDLPAEVEQRLLPRVRELLRLVLPGDRRPRLVVLRFWQYFADQLPVFRNIDSLQQ